MSLKDLFSKFFKEGYDKYCEIFNKDGLYWSIIFACNHRAWRGEEPNHEGLTKGQFFLSKQEYAKFGLKKGQANKISRKLDALQELGFIRKVGTKRGYKNATIYQFMYNDLILPPRMGATTRDSWIENGANSTDTNKESIKENNKREASPEDVELLVASIKKINTDLMIPFATSDLGGYVDKLLSDQIYNELLIPLEKRFGQKYTRGERIAKIYKLAMTKEGDGFWKGKISGFKDIHDHLPKLANLFLSSNS